MRKASEDVKMVLHRATRYRTRTFVYQKFCRPQNLSCTDRFTVHLKPGLLMINNDIIIFSFLNEKLSQTKSFLKMLFVLLRNIPFLYKSRTKNTKHEIICSSVLCKEMPAIQSFPSPVELEG